MDGQDSQSSPPSGHWQFRPGDTVSAGTSTQMPAAPEQNIPGYTPPNFSPSGTDDAVSWSASEYIAHHKSFGWYALLAAATLALASGIFFATKDKISTSIVIIVALIFGVSAGRKPSTLQYAIDNSGLHIGQKFYGYGQFVSVALTADVACSAIVFITLKSF